MYMLNVVMVRGAHNSLAYVRGLQLKLSGKGLGIHFISKCPHLTEVQGWVCASMRLCQHSKFILDVSSPPKYVSSSHPVPPCEVTGCQLAHLSNQIWTRTSVNMNNSNHTPYHIPFKARHWQTQWNALGVSPHWSNVTLCIFLTTSS